MPKSSYRERLLEDLRDPQEAASYINAAIDDSPEMLLLAMRDVAEAHTMSKVAKGAGVAREAIYRILSKKGNPRLKSFRPVLHTMGLDLSVRPRVAHEAQPLRRSAAKKKSQASMASKVQLSFTFEDSTSERIIAQQTGTGNTNERIYVVEHSYRPNLDDMRVIPAYMIQRIEVLHAQA